ncbi:MAG: hypothetical protein R3E12_06160 [Candidatus Eisenbacteria bacterium]
MGIAALRHPVGSAPLMRLDVDVTGMYRVTYEQLVAGGWNAGPVSANQLAMEERWFDESDPEDPFKSQDIAIFVADYDENGEFGPEDASSSSPAMSGIASTRPRASSATDGATPTG